LEIRLALREAAQKLAQTLCTSGDQLEEALKQTVSNGHCKDEMEIGMGEEEATAWIL
jgi:hypothetical protein